MKYILSLILLAIPCCSKKSDWIKSTVRKGGHDFDIDFHKGYMSKKKLTVHVKFTDKSKYELCCGDQWDWNKAPGIMTSIHPHLGSALMGWRYNPTSGLFEAGYYVHAKDTSATHMGGDCAIRVSPDEEWWYSIEEKEDVWEYVFSNGRSYSIPKSVFGVRIRKSTGWWFGGNQAAPKKLEVLWK